MSKLPWWALRVRSWSYILFAYILAQLTSSAGENKLVLGQKHNLLPLTRSHCAPPQYYQIEMPFELKVTDIKELWRRQFIRKAVILNENNKTSQDDSEEDPHPQPRSCAHSPDSQTLSIHRWRARLLGENEALQNLPI